MPLSGVTAIQLDLGDALQSVQKVLSVSDESYRVILEGTVREGFKRGRVVKNLAALFKKDLASVERLLSGKPRPIRTGVKRETASRYVKIIQEAGAVAWVELEAPPKAEPEVTEQPVVVPEKEPIVPDVICPRCGYQASREDDVMLVRGDCPKCGLLVRRIEDLDRTGIFERETTVYDADAGKSVYGGLDPASWERRAMASTYTFGLFVLIYFGLVVLFMLVFFPLESIPTQLGREFLFVACNNFPVMLSSLSIFVVTFVAPIFMGGRTWGQRAFDINVLYREGVGVSGQLVALAYRTAAVALVSFAPGFVFIRFWYIVRGPLEYPLAAMVVMAILAWATVWYYALRAPDKRGLLDTVARCIQTEERLLPARPWLKASIPIAAACLFLAVMGLVLPYLLRD